MVKAVSAIFGIIDKTGSEIINIRIDRNGQPKSSDRIYAFHLIECKNIGIYKTLEKQRPRESVCEIDLGLID